MHVLAAARLGDAEGALRYFRQTASIDLADTHVAIDGGIHIASLGGVWLTAVFGFAGISLLDDGVAIEPRLPASWRGLALCIQWHGRCIKITIGQNGRDIAATLESGDAMMISIRGEPHELRLDRAVTVSVTSREAELT